MSSKKAASMKKGSKSPGASTKKKSYGGKFASKRRARSEERGTLSDGSCAGGGRKKRRQAQSASMHAEAYAKTYLTEEELLATYFPRPTAPKKPPSAEFLARLHDELYTYAASHVPTRAMTAARFAIVNAVKKHARDLWGAEVEVMPFGSFVTGLYIGSSDIDLVVLDVNFGKSQKAAQLTKLGNRLRAHGLAKDVTIIPGARVPLLKYIDAASEIPVDISLGIIDGVLSANLMRKQVEAYPCFKPLTLFLKAFMQAMGLADVFKGGISSYILQVMILFHLQVQETMHPKSTTPPQLCLSSQSSEPLHPTANLGYLLFTFFELFGFTFSYEQHGIRIHDLKPLSDNNRLDCYLKASLGRVNPQKPYLLSIEDPIQKDRDIGANCFGIRRIQRCFAVAREFLCTEPREPSKSTPPTGTLPAKQHQEPTTVAATPAYIIDTVGDRNDTVPAAAASSSASAPTAAAASVPAPSPKLAELPASAVDPHSTSFGSSFGFVLSSLLALPVRYSIAELRRAAVHQPAWGTIVAKLERLETIQAKKEQKSVRKEQKKKQLAVQVAAREQQKQVKEQQRRAQQQKALVDAIDLTDAMEADDMRGKAAAAGTAISSTPVSAAVSSAEESESEEEDDSDVEEIIDEDGTAHRPIPIDDFTEDEADEDEDVPLAAAATEAPPTVTATPAAIPPTSSSTEAAPVAPAAAVQATPAKPSPPLRSKSPAPGSHALVRSASRPSTPHHGPVRSPSSDVLPPHASPSVESHETESSLAPASGANASAPTNAAAAASVAAVNHPIDDALDGDAMLAADEVDHAMELNLR